MEHWDQFYSKMDHVNLNKLAEPSSFAKFILDLFPMPRFYIDIGAGNGRDSQYFMKHGNEVLSIDKSANAFLLLTNSNFELNRQLHIELDNDFYKYKNLFNIIDKENVKHNYHRIFYCRFFLHTLNPKLKLYFINNITIGMRTGDIIAFENRIEQDKKYFFGNHERFPIANHELKKLFPNENFKIIYDEESFEFANFDFENPLIGRIIFEKI